MPYLDTPAVLAIDVDDVLWPLNESIAQKTGIDYDRIICFKATDNSLFTDAERETMASAYQDRGINRDMPMYPGAQGFARIAADPRVQAWICSNSLYQCAVDDKVRNLSAFYGEGWKRFRTMFNLIGMSDSHIKKFPDGLWCLVDDSPHNAALSGARHILMPERPWNTSGIGISQMRPVSGRVMRYRTIDEAVHIISWLLDEDFGPCPA